MRFDFTDEARQAVFRARSVAGDRGHGRITADHLFLGIVAQADPTVAEAARSLKLGLDDVAERVAEGMPPEGEAPGAGELPYAASGVEVIQGSMKAAAELGHREIHPAHLLVAVYREASESSGRLLRNAVEGEGELVSAIAQAMEGGA